ncbi:MAG: hypothetical protein K6C40_09170 [Thermoguttaceae bacterium]|nr:hypothetical protein [Thermoguttaceae bacterium]
MNHSSKFTERFGLRAFLPVIHIDSSDLAVSNARIAAESGAQGVFLINHGRSSDHNLPYIAMAIRQEFPELWIGANFLSLIPVDAQDFVNSLEAPYHFDGLWVDDTGVDERLPEDDPNQGAARLAAYRKSMDWPGLYFGGTAFKYQRPVADEDLPTVARIAARYTDVVVTSGSGTGQAADLRKIRLMKDALGDFPLGIASGITSENVDEYLPFTNAFLVSTGICVNEGQDEDFYHFDPEKVKRLADKIREYRA